MRTGVFNQSAYLDGVIRNLNERYKAAGTEQAREEISRQLSDARDQMRDMCLMKGVSSRTYLSVPYAERKEASRLGACWDAERKRWYVEPWKSLLPFKKWR